LLQVLSMNRHSLPVKALEAAAAWSGSSGRRGVYATWASHLLDDWRGVALLAARVEPDAT
jgi:hypothetical protein